MICIIFIITKLISFFFLAHSEIQSWQCGYQLWSRSFTDALCLRKNNKSSRFMNTEHRSKLV